MAGEKRRRLLRTSITSKKFESMTVSKSCLLLVIGLLVVSDVAVASFFSQVCTTKAFCSLITCLRVLVLPPAGFCAQRSRIPRLFLYICHVAHEYCLLHTFSSSMRFVRTWVKQADVPRRQCRKGRLACRNQVHWKKSRRLHRMLQTQRPTSKFVQVCLIIHSRSC